MGVYSKTSPVPTRSEGTTLAPTMCCMCWSKPVPKGRYDTCSDACHKALMSWAKKYRKLMKAGVCHIAAGTAPAVVAVVSPVPTPAPVQKPAVPIYEPAQIGEFTSPNLVVCGTCKTATPHRAVKRGKGYACQCTVCKGYLYGPASGKFKASMRLL